MAKTLRFLAAFALLGLLPAGFALWGVDLFTGYVEAQRHRAAFSRLSETLRELDRQVAENRDMEGVARRIRDDFAALERFEDAAVDAVAERWRKRHPGVFRIALVRRPFDGDFAIAGSAPLPKKTMYVVLARILKSHKLLGGDDRFLHGLTPSLRTLVARTLLDAPESAAESLALRLDTAGDCRFEGRAARFYADQLDYSRLGRQHPEMAFVFIHSFEDERRRHFAEERMAAEFAARQKGRGIDVGIGRRGTGAVEIHRGDPVIGRVIARGFSSRLDATGRERLFSFLPASFDAAGDLFLHASTARDGVFPERATWESLARLLALLHLLAVALVTALVASGRLRLYLSVRLQLAGLFMAAVALPLAATIAFGLEYLGMKREALIAGRQADLAARIAEADADASKTFERIRLGTLDLIGGLATPAALECLRRHPTGEVDLYASAEVRLFFRDLEAACLERKRAGEYEDYFLYDGTGRILWQHDARGAPTFLENTFLRELAHSIVTHVNSGTKHAAAAPAKRKEDFVTGFMTSLQRDFTDEMVKKRGLFHRVVALKFRFMMMAEPLYDGDRAVGIFAVTLQEENLARLAMRDAVAQCAASADDPVRLRAGHAKLTGDRNRHPDPAWFDGALEEMIARTAREKAPQSAEFDATLETRLAGRGGGEGALIERRERVIAVSALLKQATDLVMIALYPLSAVDAEMARMQGILAAALALSLVVAAAIGLALARRFLGPVRRIEEGVRAVARGELDIRLGIESADEFGDLSRTFDGMVAGLREKERMSRYVSEFVLDEVKREGARAGLGETRKATVLFADLRDFTTLSEAHPAEDIISMLNDYFDAMCEVIRAHGGVIDKFIGDAVMAVFDPAAERGGRGDEARAVLCALGMREALARFNAERTRRGRFTVENGIGVHTGEVIRGDIGAKGVRVDHTVIGDHVNLAARLESVSKHGRHTKIILSDRTLAAVETLVAVEPLERTTVKGKTRSVRMFEVVGLKSAADFLAGLADPSPAARVEALRALATLRDPGTAGTLAPLLADPDPDVRREAARSLARFPAARATVVPSLLLALRAEGDAPTRAALVSAVGECGDDDDRAALERHLADEDARVRANALEAIGLARDRPKLAARLRVHAADANNRIRANACVLLVSFGEVEAVDPLVAMTGSPDPLMRASGAWGLGEIATPERMERLKLAAGSADALVDAGLFTRLDRAVDALHGLLADPDRMVLRNALRALGRIGHRASTPLLVDLYRGTADEEVRHLALAALEEVGARNVARALRNG